MLLMQMIMTKLMQITHIIKLFQEFNIYVPFPGCNSKDKLLQVTILTTKNSFLQLIEFFKKYPTISR